MTKIVLTGLAVVLLAAGTAPANAVYPAVGQTAAYRIRNALPRGVTADDAIVIRRLDAGDATISIDAKPALHVSLRGELAGDVDRSAGPILEVLDISNAVAQAALSGARSVRIRLGPQLRDEATLALAVDGSRIVANGETTLGPPPADPAGPPPSGPPPPRSMQVVVAVTVTLRNGRVVRSSGDVGPQNAPGPHRSWTLSVEP